MFQNFIKSFSPAKATCPFLVVFCRFVQRYIKFVQRYIALSAMPGYSRCGWRQEIVPGDAAHQACNLLAPYWKQVRENFL